MIYGVAGSSRGTLDLTNLTASNGFIIQGDAANDYAGVSVSGIGDVNGDGIGDLLVGATGGDNGGALAGEAYVVFGVAGATRGTVDLTSLNASSGFIIQGDLAGDMAGSAVSGPGDINGEGIADLMISARFVGVGGAGRGATYVIYGVSESTPTNIDLSSLAAGTGFIINGAADFEQSGFSQSHAGDVNGDGIEDIIIGAPYSGEGGPNTGRAYVVYGTAGTSRGTLELSTLTDAQGFIIQGDAAGSRAGMSVSAAGDVNGDGIDDLIVGAPYGNDGGIDAGQSYVIYGQRPTVAVNRIGTNIGQSIFGGSFNDTIDGVGDHDRIDGAGGMDSLLGGDGNDTIYGGTSNDTIQGGTGDDSLFGDATSDLIHGGDDDDTIDGGSSADTLHGEAGADSILGDTSADVIYGGSQNDTMRGGTSGDTIYGGTEQDQIYGDDHNDSLFGDSYSDTIYGGTGNDSIDGGSYSDRLYGDAGEDSLIGGSSNDRMYGGTENDTLWGGTTNDTI